MSALIIMFYDFRIQTHNHHPTDPTDPGALFNVSVVRAVVAINPSFLIPYDLNSLFLLQNIIIFIAVKSCEHKIHTAKHTHTYRHTHTIICNKNQRKNNNIAFSSTYNIMIDNEQWVMLLFSYGYV